MSVSLSGLTLVGGFFGAGPAVARDVQAVFTVWGPRFQARSEAIVPVLTGYLRSTIYHEVKPMRLVLGARAPYAVHVEFGTRYMRAQPYLRPPPQMYLPDMLRDLRDALVKTGVEMFR